jgi:hypothetical protein
VNQALGIGTLLSAGERKNEYVTGGVAMGKTICMESQGPGGFRPPTKQS